MAHVDPAIGHLLRRAGFGVSPVDAVAFGDLSLGAAVDALINYESTPDDVDQKIGVSGYLGTTSRGPFSPNTSISDARQRWLFRMVHSRRPLQEKMALFWHNHFATGYTKIAGQLTSEGAARAMAAKPSEDPNALKGQLELFRELALGNFRDLLLAVSTDPAMVAWLDGDTNVKAKPQENYARELMELFTMGVEFYTESDVYAGARVFTGWNLRRTRVADNVAYSVFAFNPNQHDTSAKTFSFPIYPDGGKTIPARSAADGMQDGIDLVGAVARHPETGKRLARKLYAFFVNEVSAPDESLVATLSNVYYQSGYDMRAVMRALLSAPQFHDPVNYFARYAWPAELVARSLKEIGWTGFSAGSALAPLTNMGQTLFEPPDVAGWDLGPAWFSTGAMLARMNFISTLTTNQRVNLRDLAKTAGAGTMPESLLSFFVDRLSLSEMETSVYPHLLDYLRAGGAWTGSDAQLLTKAAGLVHLLAASAEYQFV
jgi:uncharacterized protein (DUF1800 family)